MQPSSSGLLVTCAYLPQTTLPDVVTNPSSDTFTSITVPCRDLEVGMGVDLRKGEPAVVFWFGVWCVCCCCCQGALGWFAPKMKDTNAWRVSVCRWFGALMDRPW